MKIHIVIDFMFIYYKYKNTLMSGRLKTLTGRNPNKPNETMDISMIYYPLREIESIRRKYETDGTEVTISVCFDSPSNRRDEDVDYKGTRKKTLGDSDFEKIEIIRKILDKAGHNVYKRDGVEADDLVYSILESYKDSFDANIIFTTDYDLLVNVQPKVYYRKYRAGKGFEDPVGVQNFRNYVRNNGFGEMIQYNGILLYKSICGDSSDNIPGIKGIGKAKFDKLIRQCEEVCLIGYGRVAYQWDELLRADRVRQLLRDMCYQGFINRDQLVQAEHSLDLVQPRFIDSLAQPVKRSTINQRQVAYGLYGMHSLID